MYCPQCGQIQAGGDTRYCSRCGLSLYEIGLWLAGDGGLINPQARNRQLSPRRKHILRAAKVSFFSAVLAPIAFLFAIMDKEPGWLVAPLSVLFGSLIWMLYCRLFMDGEPPAISNRAPSFKADETNYLPPRRALELEPQRVNTSEIPQPGSVTEYTTNLLKKRE